RRRRRRARWSFTPSVRRRARRETAIRRRVRALAAVAPAKASAVVAERPHHRKAVLVVVTRRQATAPRQPSVARSRVKSISTACPHSPQRTEKGTRPLRRKRGDAREGFSRHRPFADRQLPPSAGGSSYFTVPPTRLENPAATVTTPSATFRPSEG